MRFGRTVTSLLAFASVPGWSTPCDATEVDDSDRYDFVVHGETHAELFRRALLPGPNGALVETDTVLPVHQYVRLHARDIDTSWQRDSIDVELGAFGRVWLGELEGERRFDGDVQTANARYQHGPLWLRAGRQHVAGGAARYARFDGVAVGVVLDAGLELDAYAGLSVLPRWDARPGYHQLGSAADTLLRDPEAIEEPERSGHLLGGGRIGYFQRSTRAGVSFHEQHEPLGLSRRGIAADARTGLGADAAVGGSALMELDARRLQDARVFFDFTPLPELDASVEYLHTEPALFLSRQSVLAVFSTDAYDEGAASALWRVTDAVALDGEGAIQVYDERRQGARGEIGVRLLPGTGRRTSVRLSYARVQAIDNGYHSLRASLTRRITRPVTGTLEAYSFLYDDRISGHKTSEVFAGTLAYRVSEPLSVLWGASLAQSPYARLDAQALVRASYDFDFSRGVSP